MRKTLLFLLAILLPALASAQGPSSAQIEAAKGLVKLYTTAGLPATCPPGKRVWDTTADETKVCLNDGVTWQAVGGTGGSGTTGKIPKWTASTTLGDSLLSDGGTNITLASGQLLLPAGSAANPSVALGGEQTGLYLSSAGVISYATLGTVRMRMAAGGIYPAATGAIPTGLSGNRWSAGYFGGATLTASTPAIDIATTWNNGAVQFIGATIAATETASASTSRYFQILGGTLGTTDEFYVAKGGSAVAAGIVQGSGYNTTDVNGEYYIRDRFLLRATIGDGIAAITNYGGTDFTRLQFGGTTSSFPALKRNGAALAIRLADDSADAALTSGAFTSSGNIQGSSLLLGDGSRGTINMPADGVVSFINNAGTSFSRITLGGSTSSFPALKRNGAGLLARLADDSADTNVRMSVAIITGTASPLSGDSCTKGTVTWDASYIYVCTAVGAWKRAALTGGY